MWWFLSSDKIVREPIQITNTRISQISRPQIVDTKEYIMKDEVWANPESTLYLRETYQEKPYRINEGSGGNDIQIYLPTFFEQSIAEQDQFSEKLRKFNTYTLTFNIFSYTQFKKDKIRRLYNSIQPQFSSVNFRFFDIPVNYYELFSEFWFNLTGKDLTIEFYGKMFPDGFMMDSVIANIKAMLKHSLSDSDKLNSISFNHEEAGNIYFVLTPLGSETLQQLPTKSLYANRILIDWNPSWPGETLHGKEKIEQFFQKNPIETIQLESVGEKKNNTITLYWF